MGGVMARAGRKGAVSEQAFALCFAALEILQTLWGGSQRCKVASLKLHGPHLPVAANCLPWA